MSADLVKRLRALYDSKRLHIDYAGMSDSQNVYRIQAKQRDMAFIMEAAYTIERMETDNALLCDHLTKAQHALLCWLPNVRGDGTPLDEQAATDAILLGCLETDQTPPEYGEQMRARIEHMEKVVEAARNHVCGYTTCTEACVLCKALANLDKPTDSFNDLISCHCFNERDRKLCMDKHKCRGPAEALKLDKLP